MIQTCKQCGKSFELTPSEIAFFNRKGLDLPRRCADCREQNREQHRNTPPSMPGIQQVREVDPGFHHPAPAVSSRNRQWKRYDEEVPFWKQKAQNKEGQQQLISFILLLVIVVSVVTGGTIYGIKRLKPEPKQTLNNSAIPSVSEAATTAVPETTSTTVPATTSLTIPATTAETVPKTTSPPVREVTYYLNTYRKKFHRPDCPSVNQMNWKSRQAFYGTREEAIEQGYSPCHNCNP